MPRKLNLNYGEKKKDNEKVNLIALSLLFKGQKLHLLIQFKVFLFEFVLLLKS